MASPKPVQVIVLDAGPILKNDPSLSTLLAKSEQLFTVSSVISEIKDATTRARVETTLLPFLTIRNPKPQSVSIVTDFARRTGDLAVLSRTDVSLLSLAYELECERNGGDWRLRKVPGQKTINGPVPQKVEAAPANERTDSASVSTNAALQPNEQTSHEEHDLSTSTLRGTEPSTPVDAIITSSSVDDLTASVQALQTSEGPSSTEQDTAEELLAQPDVTLEEPESGSSDSEGWITPSNLKKHQAKDSNAETTASGEQKTMQVATITTDFAMQNVLLQMGLNLLSSSIQQVRHIKTYILRCHACFNTVRDMTKQFCPRCGKPTLTRVSCSTNAKGEFQIHLKRNMQWNHRGDRFSIPKPTSGTASGKVGTGKGGGKGGWGQELILAEDQKEYLRATQGESRRKEKNLMDEDYLPSILTGDRGKAGGRPKIGGGRNVNSKKRN